MKYLNSRWRFPLVCVLLVLAKLVLIAPNEIISIQDDSAVYANQSLGAWTLGYPEGYPIWLIVCRMFDVPQRIAIECLFLLGAVTVAYSVRRFVGNLAGYVTLTLLVFSSSTLFLFNLGLADGFFTCLTLLALSFTIRVFAAQNRAALIAWTLALGGTLGMMAITRNEDPLIGLWVLLLVGFCALLWRQRAASLLLWKTWREPLLAGVLVSLTALSVVFALCLSYYLTDGIFARGIALIPGHVRLLRNLARIQTNEPQRRFIPISKKSRELAYAVSPAFAKYRPLIENPADGWQVISRQFGIPQGEIGGGWIWHAINTKVIPSNGGRPALAEAQYKKMNAEIEAAFKDGRLKHRFVLHPLLGGDPFHLLTELPPSVSAVLTSAFSSTPENRNDQGFETESFDEAFVRREALIPRLPEVKLQGWAFVNKPGHKIVNVIIGSAADSSGRVAMQARPDVVDSFALQNGWKPTVLGFSADLKSGSSNEVNATYFLDDGSQLQSNHLTPHKITELENKIHPGDNVLQGIDGIGEQGGGEGLGKRHNLELELLAVSSSSAVTGFSILVVLLGIVATGVRWLRTRDSRWRLYFTLLLFGLISWCARVLFYSLLDARAWPGNQIRYLAPAHAFWLVLVAISVESLVLFMSQRQRNAGASASPAPLRRPS